MTKPHSMNHCTCRSEIDVPSAPPRVEQTVHIVAETRQSEVTHRCSWTFCLSVGIKNGDKLLTITVVIAFLARSR